MILVPENALSPMVVIPSFNVTEVKFVMSAKVQAGMVLKSAGVPDTSTLINPFQPAKTPVAALEGVPARPVTPLPKTNLSVCVVFPA